MEKTIVRDDILEHIKKSWHIVSALDPARDPKVEKIQKSFLYIPACEDIDAIRRLVVAPEIEVRYLPDDWRKIDQHKHGLLYLPNEYVTSGPRFQEMYYWDSRWNVEALLLHGKISTAKGIVENCFYAIDCYGGFVPTANRTYYLSRSQPPFLAPMVQSVAAYLEGRERRDFLVRAEAALIKEYEGFWRKYRYTEKTGLFHYGCFNDGALGLCPEVVYGERHPVTGLSHYERLAEKLMELPDGDPLRKRFLNEETHSLTDEAVIGDRAMRESGFDPSMHLGFYGLETHNYNPVCLNTLLEQQCRIIADIDDELGLSNAEKWRGEALQLKNRINEYLWDEEQGLFMAYDYAQEQKATIPFLTSIFPLWTGLVSPEQARRFHENLRLFDTGHGLATSSHTGDCQWDGYIWGFFADIGFDALARQGFFDDAVRIGRNFKQTVHHVWEADGTFCEKYDHRGRDNISEVTMGYLSNVLDFSPTKAALVIISERLGIAPAPVDESLSDSNHPRLDAHIEHDPEFVKIIADIGGTNARFGTVTKDGTVENIVIYKVTNTVRLVDAVTRYKNEHLKEVIVTAIAIAAAGPVLAVQDHLQVKFTNSPWICDQVEIAAALNISKDQVTILNDFQAAGYAILTLNPSTDFVSVKEGQPVPKQPILIVGPGTGLGIGRLTGNTVDAIALATEGGHAPAATVNERQRQLTKALEQLFPGKSRFSNEDMYSFGRGLSALYAANRILQGEQVASVNMLGSEAITAAALKEDKTACAAVKDFCFGLGVMVGEMALNPLSYGGIYLIGVKEKLGDLFDKTAFLHGLCENDKLELISQIPISHIDKNVPAFDGLIHYLNQNQPTVLVPIA